MRTAGAAAQRRHRAQDNRTIVLTVLLATAALFGASCGSSLPRPPRGQVKDSSEYIEVPFPPNVPPPEFVPPSPDKNAVWIDGNWEWLRDHYAWRFGTWVLVPPGVKRARWTLVRREADGQLFFLPASWRDADNNRIDDPAWARSLGPRARARSSPGGAPPNQSMLDELITAAPEDE